MFHVEQLKMNKEYIYQKIKRLPLNAGVYQFLDKDGKLLYVGKAKNLKKRVSSYFTKNHNTSKLRVLVSKIVEIEHIIVESEQDALLLENNLIKKHQPRYNAQMKDDKTYPWICITSEPFPRVFMTRKKNHKQGTIFGPYPSVRVVRSLLDMLFTMYKIRSCKHNLSEKNIAMNKYKVCLEFHIGRCLGGCQGLQTEEIYQSEIDEVKKILAGSVHSLLNNIRQRMNNAAERFRFEEAHELKTKLDYLKKYQSKSIVASSVKGKLLVFSIVDSDNFSYINMLKVVDGAVVASRTLEVRKKMKEELNELLLSGMYELSGGTFSGYNEILLPFHVDFQIKEAIFRVPLKGDKKKLLKLSEKNALESLREKNIWREKKSKGAKEKTLLEQIKKDLRLSELPVHIECFDNSNIQGTNPVASCVVFRNAKPSKKDYRKFKIKTVQGANDFASMKEIVYRRYARLQKEKENLPQLVIIDGGKGQLSAAVEAITDLGLYKNIAILGIAKRLEELYFPNDTIPLYLDKRSETLRVLRHLRDEAHRFAISFHRNLRSKGAIKSALREIPGIGEKTEELLLRRFGSIKGIKKASFNELADIAGNARATKINSYIRKQK